MQKPPLDPDVADTAPADTVLTRYDEEHIVTYLRLLDADADGADWREVTEIVLHIDPDHEPARARQAFRQSPRPRKMDDRTWIQAAFAWRRVGFELIGGIGAPAREPRSSPGDMAYQPQRSGGNSPTRRPVMRAAARA